MKRALLTAAFAIGLSALFAACGGGGGGGPATAPVATTSAACSQTPGYVWTNCGTCLPVASAVGQCTAQYGNQYGSQFGGQYGGQYAGQYGNNFQNGNFQNGNYQNGGYAFNPYYGQQGSYVQGYRGNNQVPPCAYNNSCYCHTSGDWFFYVNLGY